MRDFIPSDGAGESEWAAAELPTKQMALISTLDLWQIVFSVPNNKTEKKVADQAVQTVTLYRISR